VRAAGSAQEAFQEVRRWRPHVLVADIGMPVEDGYSLLRRVRALSASEGGSIPAAALTAYAQDEDRQRALAAGFQEHVAKPVPPERLASVVARLASRDVN
jgi:CheY-like chemotaxis protein